MAVLIRELFCYSAPARKRLSRAPTSRAPDPDGNLDAQINEAGWRPRRKAVLSAPRRASGSAPPTEGGAYIRPDLCRASMAP
jgi:hypothetical protein